MDQGLRERRHNRPIDIAGDEVARVRRDYDSSVPIVLPEQPKIAEQAITPKMLNDTLTSVFDQVMTYKNLKWPVGTKWTVTPTPPTMPIVPDTLVITRGVIERLSMFQEPQANGVTLKRWDVGYWTERDSPLSQPGGKFLRCQEGMETWITFRVLSYSVSSQRGEEMLFIQAWGY